MCSRAGFFKARTSLTSLWGPPQDSDERRCAGIFPEEEKRSPLCSLEELWRVRGSIFWDSGPLLIEQTSLGDEA